MEPALPYKNLIGRQGKEPQASIFDKHSCKTSNKYPQIEVNNTLKWSCAMTELFSFQTLKEWKEGFKGARMVQYMKSNKR